jgi:hypothetical protein
MTQDIAQAPDTDDHDGDGKQVGDDDPLDVLERGREHLGQGWQGYVGDAYAQGGQQHRQCKAAERPSAPRCRLTARRDCCV